jgi:hypothetical protein
MLEHCRLKYNFDFLAAKARLSSLLSTSAHSPCGHS